MSRGKDNAMTTPASLTAAATSSDRSATVSPDIYKDALRRHPGGVAVITADPGDGPVALTATSVTSISAVPALILFSVSDLSSSTPSILRSGTVVVHLLEADRLDLAQLCATSGIDRFADATAWSRLPTGEPLYHGVRNWLRCRIENRLVAGASTVIVGEVIEASEVGDDVGDPLVYHNRVWHRLSDSSRADNDGQRSATS